MKRILTIFGLAALGLAASAAQAQRSQRQARQRPCRRLCKTWIEPPLNGSMPLISFSATKPGAARPAPGIFLRQKPVVLAFVYYGCPMFVIRSTGRRRRCCACLVQSGRDYGVVSSVSFPRNAGDGAEKKSCPFPPPANDSGWHFHHWLKNPLKLRPRRQLRFSLDAKSIYSPASGVRLTPDGPPLLVISAVDIPADAPRTRGCFRGKIGTPLIVLLYCYHTTPRAAYTARRFRRSCGSPALTVLCLVGGI